MLMTKFDKILIGIRKSELSKAQTNIFVNEFNVSNDNKLNQIFQIETVETTGDINKEHRLDQIGGKGLFVKEIEEKILKGEIDIGVHSLKDLPTTTSNEKLKIVCWMKRSDARDVLISNSGKDIFSLPPKSIIGTSSIRRRSQILNVRKDLSIKLLRGNVDTRIKKLKNEEYDAIILSLAGLQRLKLQHLITQILDPDIFLPAACQGAIGIQGLSDRGFEEFFSNINHEDSQLSCSSEREILKIINANCNSPVSVFSKIRGDEMLISFQIYDHDGTELFKKNISGNKYNYVNLTKELGTEILTKVGQKKINELDKLNYDFDYQA